MYQYCQIQMHIITNTVKVLCKYPFKASLHGLFTRTMKIHVVPYRTTAFNQCYDQPKLCCMVSQCDMKIV
jgi:hypothetical protein